MASNYNRVAWRYGSNIYEVNVRQYTAEGTFNAFAEHLPRLRNMGIEILWFMPITPISIEKRLGTLGSYYACSSYTEVNPEFGTKEDFKNLVQEAHELGFKVIIDWVANHTGWDHHWTIEHPEWYVKDATGNFIEQHGWEDVIDLDYTRQSMRMAMIESMQYWIRHFDIDGFRCDMAHLVPLDFWHQARSACDALKPLFWLAECEVTEYHEVFDVSYAWAWMHITEKIMRGENTLNDMRRVLHAYNTYPQHAAKLFFTANHDENSWNGTEYEKYGNAAKAFAVFTCLWRDMPLIYSGQELPNFKRLKFFDKDPIEWQSPQLHDFYKSLLELRRNNAAFSEHSTCTMLQTNDDDDLFVFLRTKDTQRVLVLINFSNKERLMCNIQHTQLTGSYTNLFSGLEYKLSQQEKFELQPWEVFVYTGNAE